MADRAAFRMVCHANPAPRFPLRVRVGTGHELGVQFLRCGFLAQPNHALSPRAVSMGLFRGVDFRQVPVGKEPVPATLGTNDSDWCGA